MFLWAPTTGLALSCTHCTFVLADQTPAPPSTPYTKTSTEAEMALAPTRVLLEPLTTAVISPRSS